MRSIIILGIVFALFGKNNAQVDRTIVNHPTRFSNTPLPAGCSPRNNCRRCPVRAAGGVPAGFLHRHVLPTNQFNNFWLNLKDHQEGIRSDVDVNAIITQLTERRYQNTCQRPTGQRGSSFGPKYPANTYISQETVDDITIGAIPRFRNCTKNSALDHMDCDERSVKLIQIEYNLNNDQLAANNFNYDLNARIVVGEATIRYSARWIQQPGQRNPDIGDFEVNHMNPPDLSQALGLA